MRYPSSQHTTEPRGFHAGSEPSPDDEFFSDPAADDYLDRCLFELRSSLADFRSL